MAKNWLIEAARRAGMQDSGRTDLELDSLSMSDAWALVARTFGVRQPELAVHVAAYFDLPVADFETLEPRAQRMVPEKFARRHEIFPLREDDRRLVIATADPTDLDTEYSLAFASGLTPTFAIASPEAIREALKRYGDSRTSPSKLMETVLSGVESPLIDDVLDEVRVLVAEKPEERGDVREVDDAPVIRLVNIILLEAIQRRASDIHIGPGPGGGAVRFRIDGVLQDYMQMPIPALNRVVSRIKILGTLDITDRLRPQDGRARIMVSDLAYDLRISTVPTRESENAVIRILDPRGSKNFTDLEFPTPELDKFRQLLSHRSGIVIVTGPTGSGKTTTLYAGIGELATGDVNIMTVEDPVEYELPGVTQIQIETERDVTFVGALRAILRQDPDVIFVGEIRDLETAQVAVQASTTGHLVLTTLHTNSALGILTRLADLGLDLFTIESVIRGALAQRLVRKLCAHCSLPIGDADDLTEEEETLARRYGTRPVRRTVGCEKCLHTGYRGRIPVAEVFHMDYKLAELIARGASPVELERTAIQNGMRTMLQVALERVRAGETTLQEVARVLGQASNEEIIPPLPAAAPAIPLVPAEPDEPELLIERTALVEPEPVREPEEEEEPEPEPEPPPRRARKRKPAPRAEEPAHILVVDDDPTTRRYLRTLLEHHAYRVSEAKNGPAALELLKQEDESYALVLLDLNMPKLGGGEVLSVLRSAPRTADIPVVILTAANGTSESVMLNQGADDFIAKPIVPDRVIARVRASLRRAEASRER